jgi:hypothetical protein
MVLANQLERLRKDSRELGHYINRLKKKGKTETATKVAKRRAYLDDMIAYSEGRTQ